MNSTNVSSNASTTVSSAAPASEVKIGRSLYTQTTCFIIATMAFLGNLLVILLILVKKGKFLKKSYNILILSLAMSDILTALMLVTNPAMVLGDAFPYPNNHVLGDVFCRIIWSRTFLFQLLVFSAYICVALATERWFAVVKPQQYNQVFNKKRTLVYIFLVWLWSVILCASNSFQLSYISSNPPNSRCKWNFGSATQTVRIIIAVIQTFFKMAFPCLTMLFLFIHMVYKARKSTVTSVESKAKLRGKITRMVGAASLALIICFAPSQINYTLAVAGKTRLDNTVHHVLSLLALVNSCLNPFIYGLSNKNYRQGYQQILLSLYPWCIKRHGNRVVSRPISRRTDSTKPGTSS